MRRVILILALLIGVARAATPQDEAKTRFTAEIRNALRSMLEAQIAENPDHPRNQELKRNLDQQVEGMIPLAFEAFSLELTLTEPEATELIKNGPDDRTNQEAIHTNRKVMDQSPLPKPAVVTLMLQQLDAGKSVSGWRLETLRRLTAGTVRQLKERGELK
jgi:hypothetical protein